jgi:hypothetical protein
METSMRRVCEGCLRSIEVGKSAGSGSSDPCPYCGAVLESDPSRAGSSESATLVHAPTLDLEQTIDWAETWARGSFGSLGRFQLRERLGDGGFGQVFRAYDPRLDRDVAVKVLKDPHPCERVMARFFREARAVARLDHPNIVTVHDAGFDNGRCWVAYQLVSGRPLWWYRDHQPMDAVTTARIIRSLADAIDHAHHMGVVHRDLKPSNVLIDDDGRPRLIDFGLARRSDLESDLTRDGAIVGTPAYMSPEQALGQSRNVDERSDVYSLGVMLYELLFGCPPGDGRKALSANPRTLANGGTARPPGGSTSRDRTAVPSALLAICVRATAVDPAARHPSARALSDELSLWLRKQTNPGGTWWGMPARALAGLSLTAVVLGALIPGWLGGIERTRSRSSNGNASEVMPDLLPVAAIPKPVGSREASTSLVGNLDKHRYHRANCPYAASIADRNRILLTGTEDAVSRGFEPCERCRPGGVDRREKGGVMHSPPPP